MSDDLERLADHPKWPGRYPPPPACRTPNNADRWQILPDGYRDGRTGIRWKTLGGGRYVPDLKDPATLGCLLGMIESFTGISWGADHYWRVTVFDLVTGIEVPRQIAKGRKKAAAIVQALLIQWGAP